MSLNLEMLQVVRLAPRVLGDSSDLVAQFLLSLQNSDGGFSDRAGKSDLYYSSFAIGGLMGLQRPLPLEGLRKFLAPFEDGDGLDLVHLSCLSRCLSAVHDRRVPRDLVDKLCERLETFRAGDGGFSSDVGDQRGSVYASFLALGMYQDLGRPMPLGEQVLDSILSFRCPDGGFANGVELAIGLTPPSCAGAMLFRHLGGRADAPLVDWLWQRFRAGGFCVMEGIDVPDLLSTATALHALSGMQVDLTPIAESGLDFVDSLWNARGGFHGGWEDDEVDCEYTYYGLLALGHLSLL